MRLKTYFASGVDSAMMLARQELGPEAMLVHSKRTAGEAQTLGAYEVVFAVADLPEAVPPAPSAPAAPQVGAGAPPDGVIAKEMAAEVSGLRSMMEQTLRLVRRSETLLRAKDPIEGSAADLDAILEDLGFRSAFRRRLQEELQRTTAGGTLRQKANFWFDRQLKTAPQLGRPGFARKCVALVGPPGAGKSSSLIKMAAQYGVSGRRPAQILSMDAERVGAAEALRVNAGILGIGFQLLDTTHALSQALAEHANKDLILIDTPGFASGSMDEAASLATFLAARREIDIHLVVPADLTWNTLETALNNYQIFEPAKILFTRTDETRELGAVIEAAIETRLPLSFFGSGQRIPEDLAPVDKTEILGRLLPNWLDEEPGRTQSKYAAA